ncbi:MAG: nickel-dependent hydrogenase large subunit [Nitrososphaeria archaeon]|jgi:NADH-quinone oxidoreductase subunit D
MSTFDIPIGPQHPALPEPLLLKLEVEGEAVVGVNFDVSYMHRGIEKLLETRSYFQGLPLIERICGICNAAHGVCYTLNVEKLYDKEIPKRAQYLRLIVEELSRIHSHLLWLGIAAYEIGFNTMFMYTWRDREHVMDMLESITGNRITTEYSQIGGVRRDIPPELASRLLKVMDVIEERTKYYIRVALTDRVIAKRTQGVGYLSTADAKSTCSVGPIVRASSVKFDVRASDPYVAHDEVPFNVITSDSCDVFGRVVVRAKELLECVNMIRYAVQHLPEGPFRIKLPMKPNAGEALTRVEAPRGELLHYTLSDGTPKPYRYKVRTPTLANLGALRVMLTSKGRYVVNIGDIPIIYGALDPCICCTARVNFVDVKKGKSWIWSLDEIREMSRRGGLLK